MNFKLTNILLIGLVCDAYALTNSNYAMDYYIGCKHTQKQGPEILSSNDNADIIVTESNRDKAVEDSNLKQNNGNN